MIRYLLIVVLGALPCMAGEEFKKFAGCVLVETEWADGDSFAVRFPDGKEQTIRLYGADCIEMHVNGDDSNARRLRDQRRYFGIDDILLAKSFGEAAKSETRRVLARPFTVYTTFADGRGDGRFERIYGIVETAEGKNLSEWLVSQGLARAFGVVRQLPDGTSGGEWRQQLADLELVAARAGRGVWAKTDWEKLTNIRKAVEGKPVDLNHAARDELMSLPGVGEKTALNIIEARPFDSVADLDHVNGIGPALLLKIRAFVSVTPP